MHILKTNLNIFLSFAFLFYFCFYFYQFVICFFEMDFKYSPATSSWLPELQAWATMSRYIYISKICASEPQVPHSTEAGLAMQLKAQKEDSQSSTRSKPLKKTPEGPGCSRGPGVFLQKASFWGLPAESQLV